MQGAQPNAANLIGNPDFPGETSTGGENWPEFLAAADTSSPSLLYDIAVSGATVDNTFVAASTGVSTFIEQVSGFTATYGPNSAGAGLWNSEDSLFMVWFGINDISNGYTSPNWQAGAQTAIGNYFQQATNLYNAGARNIVFLGVPPIQRTPKHVSDAPDAMSAYVNAILYYNQLLQDGVNSFTSAHSDASIWYLDTIPVFDMALNDPTAYGSPDATCFNDDGTSCLWWNNFHPGEAIDQLVSEAVMNLTGA